VLLGWGYETGDTGFGASFLAFRIPNLAIEKRTIKFQKLNSQ